MNEANIKVGDDLKIWVTGMIGNFRAKCIEMDERRGGRPILEVLVPETGEPDPGWAMKLKDGDYIVRGYWNDEGN
jgi:hypothetical protein